MRKFYTLLALMFVVAMGATAQKLYDAVGFGDDMLSLLPEQERIILTIFSSNAYLNQRIEIARQALHCEKSQVCRLRNRALDHARQLFTGSWEDGSGCPLKIGDTEGTKLGHTG